MDIQQARYVLELARQCNFTRAANALFISQPTLSAQIASVEEEMGVKLFNRTTRAVLLTDNGRMFCDRLQPILEEWDQLMLTMQLYREDPAPTISIGFTFRAHASGLLDKCIDFFDSHKSYRSALIDVTKDEVASRLHSGDLDAALCPLSEGEENSEPFANIRTIPLIHDRGCVLVGKSHPLAGRDHMNINELNGETIIVGEENSHEDRHLRQMERDFDIHPGKVIRTNSLEMMINLLRAGRGVTLGSYSFAETYNIAAVPLDPERYSSLCLLYRKDTKNPGILELRNYLVEAVTK